MEIKLEVYMNDSETNINFDDNKSTIKISDKISNNDKAIYMLLNNNNVIYIGRKVEGNKFDRVVTINCELNEEYLEYYLIKEAMENGVKLDNNPTLTEPDLSKDQISELEEYKDKLVFILKNFGYDLFKVNKNDESPDKARPAKARHKWTKEISQIEFTAKSKGGEGKAIWRKRDELVLLSGAKIVTDPQLNKDGSLNYSAQFAQKLRADYLDKVVNNITTEDIVFPSPNVLGLFLFYGGQNTWAELKDSNGKSLDDWSRVD